MTEIQEALGEVATLEIDGKTWNVGPTTVEVIRQWEQWMQQETMGAMYRSVGGLGPDALQGAFDAVARLAANGDFDFFGESSLRRMNTIEGKTKLLYWRLKPNHPEIDERTVRGWVEKEAVKIGRALMERSQVPNSEAPATPGANLNESDGSTSSPPSSKQPDGISPASVG